MLDQFTVLHSINATLTCRLPQRNKTKKDALRKHEVKTTETKDNGDTMTQQETRSISTSGDKGENNKETDNGTHTMKSKDQQKKAQTQTGCKAQKNKRRKVYQNKTGRTKAAASVEL